MTTDAAFDEFTEISRELGAANEALQAVFAERGIADDPVPAIASSDTEALAAVKRFQAAQARLNAWLATNAPADPAVTKTVPNAGPRSIPRDPADPNPLTQPF